jgi:hypothetical protein
LCWWIFAGVVVTFIFILALILPLRLSSDTVRDNEDNDHTYAPTDTTIISFSHPFCDKLTLHSPDFEFYIQVTLFLLDRTPPLEKADMASFYREPRLTNNYEYWRMFLYPGSRVGHSACSVESTMESPVAFYLVKGNQNYEKWRSDHSETHVYRQEIDATCGTDDNVTFSYEVKEEDNYYFIYFSGDSASETITAVTFDFERTLYDIMNSTIVSQCRVILNDSTSCEVSVPYSSKPVALLELVSLEADPMEWNADIRVSITCSARIWLYAVIAIAALAFVGLLALSAILVYLCCYGKKNRRTSSETSPREQREDSHLTPGKRQYDAPPPK